MEISYNWLLEYLPQPISINELSTILTSIGLEVEAIEKFEVIPGSLEGLVIGKVITCEQHPNADKLKKTTVDIGTGTLLSIVCGAPNVAAGQTVVVAPVGASVHPNNGEAFEIKKAKIRGEQSEGMICAEDEIGLGESHSGIMVLPDDIKIGTPANQYFNIPQADYTIHIGLTPNRSDANSHIGVAKDICAHQTHHTGSEWKVKLPEFKENQSANNNLSIDVTVEAAEHCPRYAGVTIEGIEVAPSPEWLQQRLKAIGQRPINNIVDITNYVLHEYGQPLHAFDYDTIIDKKIIVKTVAENTTFVTLDEKERKLRSEDLVICNNAVPMCLAGVFGGINSGVTENTKNIFLESAYFNPRTIRRTSLHHGLRTDAATHFEKSVDINMVIPALKRGVALISDIAGGKVSNDVIDIYPQVLQPKEITFRFDYINNLCGKNYSVDGVRTILQSLGFVVLKEDIQTMTVSVPSNKADVLLPADIAEEIIRIDGLDNVAMSEQLSFSLNKRKNAPIRKWKNTIAQFLSANGMQEIITNSITNSKYYPEKENIVHLLNSLSSELDIMRPAMLESGLEVIAYNINRNNQDLYLYEFGNIYFKASEGKYTQFPKLAIWISGNVQNKSWNTTTQKSDIFYIKGLIESILESVGIAKLQNTYQNNTITWHRGKDTLATAQKVNTKTLKQFDIKQDVYYAEIDMEMLVSIADKVTIKYSEVPKFPAVRRDLAFVLDKAIQYQQIEAIVKKQKWSALQQFDLFDIFESDKLGTNKKSLALSFTFQLQDRTLTDEEVEAMMQKLIAECKSNLQAEIRS